MIDNYILRGKEAIPCEDIVEWAQKYEKMNRRVALDYVGDIKISTVFLGLDHAFDGGPPMLFETMVFGGDFDQDGARCSTWGEAEEQHAEWLKKVKEAAQ